MEIKEGAIVQLKSGGPNMTVEEIFDKSAKCVWFEKNDEGGPHKAEFLIVSLNIADKQTK